MATMQQTVGSVRQAVGSGQQAVGSVRQAVGSVRQAARCTHGLGIGDHRNPKIPKSQNPILSPATRQRGGFTLIDLLVAITVIGILMAITLGAVGSARQATRIDKTRYTITKLHYVMMGKYDSYRTRRLPIAIPPGTFPQVAALYRVNAMRDLMRMEMPDRWSDVFNVGNPSDPDAVALYLTFAPSLTHRYRRIYFNSAAASDPQDKWGAAECLYMIVMAIPDAAGQFHESEIADTDNDGLPEFVDAWGTPIRFIRWPSGFYWDPPNDFYGESDLQFGPQGISDKYQADPFDPRGVLLSQGSFALFPLVYSAGPDKEFDINTGREGPNGAAGNQYTYTYRLEPHLTGTPENIDPFQADMNNIYVGCPANDDDGSQPFSDLHHYDNIHNHRTGK
ncbi:MAG: type II secretion system protein [Pirellulales bacterium]|nr:type II secretion system protein [Pirellulales bacterium]